MTRLLLSLAGALLLFALFDAAVPHLLDHPGVAGEAFTQDGASLAAPARLRDLLSDARYQVARTRRRFEAIPSHKPPGELRVFLVGNSAALFTIDPRVVRDVLAKRFPDRDVRVHSLMLPLIRTRDEGLLLAAAQRKQPDVIVMTPALKGLHEGDSFLSNDLRRAFPEVSGLPAPPGALDRLRAALYRHSNLLHSSSELRAVVLRRLRGVIQPDSDREAAQRMEAGFAAISQAAGRGDRQAVFAAFEAHGMMFLLREEHFQRRLAPGAAAFDALDAAAARLAPGTLGLAVFMPVNPLFREGGPLAGFEAYHLDGAYAARLARRALASYRAAGFRTFDRIDFLPADAFFDLVHVHGKAMDRFSNEVARLLGAALSDPASP